MSQNRKLRVLIGCEFSGVVREEFRKLGHDAWSCDLLPAEDRSPFHITGDLLAHLSESPGRYDLGIFHPECTYLNHAGVRWLYKDGKRWLKDALGNVIGENPRDLERWRKMEEGAAFFLRCLNANIERVAVENSEMHPHALKLVGVLPTQSIQPWQFGHGEVKESCYWLKNLPPLQPSKIVEGREPRVHYCSPGPNRWKERARTLRGIGLAMARQWGDYASCQLEENR